MQKGRILREADLRQTGQAGVTSPPKYVAKLAKIDAQESVAARHIGFDHVVSTTIGCEFRLLSLLPYAAQSFSELWHEMFRISC